MSLPLLSLKISLFWFSPRSDCSTECPTKASPTPPVHAQDETKQWVSTCLLNFTARNNPLCLAAAARVMNCAPIPLSLSPLLSRTTFLSAVVAPSSCRFKSKLMTLPCFSTLLLTTDQPTYNMGSHCLADITNTAL